MRCAFCKGDLEAKAIRYVQEYKGRVIFIENVPAEVCKQCGETVLRPEVLTKIQELVWHQPAPKREDRVPVYDLGEVA